MITRAWCARDAPVVAVELLNKVLVSRSGGHVVRGRITETEAYTADDPASHTFNGQTERNAVMFGPAGVLYVYLSYGIHHCANVVTGTEGDGQAVLIRAVEPVEGLDTIRKRRGGRRDAELTDGPGKVGQAFGLDLSTSGSDLIQGNPIQGDPIQSIPESNGDRLVWLTDDGVAPPPEPIVGPRIGISKAVERPWRFRVPRSRTV